MVSPGVDDCAYLDSLPKRLRDVGLYVPSYVGFETPFPGTPLFRRLAAESEPTLLPDTLLRDYTGYTLVVRPKHERIERFIESYRQLLDELYSVRNRVAGLANDLPQLAARRHWLSIAVDVVLHAAYGQKPAPERTYIAGTDALPPETVPLCDADFDSEEERARILEPLRVTDKTGGVLPMWLGAEPVFADKGKVRVYVRPPVAADSDVTEADLAQQPAVN